MKIKFVEISNFRKLKSTHIDFSETTTIFVGANNSGKTSAMIALRYFLIEPAALSLRDITIANWSAIDTVGAAWEIDPQSVTSIDHLLPSMDVWVDVPVSEIRHVMHILPTLDWNGGLIGVRLQYRSTATLKAEYLLHRTAAKECVAGPPTANQPVIWPSSLTDFLERRLRGHTTVEAYPLNPAARVAPMNGLATPQTLAADVPPFEKNPFKTMLRIDEIKAQRDFADSADGRRSADDDSDERSRRYKRRLSDQLRTYYDRHLDPAKAPSAADYEALGALRTAERTFDSRLKAGFGPALEELEDLGYPGVTNPKLEITTQLRTTDGLKHGSAVQYKIADPASEDARALQLPEDYLGLGYQNLIAMVFMLMSFRDDWMRVGKAAIGSAVDVAANIPPLHLVLVEEPEAHLHAQVQQVFINKAYTLLRNRPELLTTEFSTQLVVSTHSSHVAHETDFANLRYFRRRPAGGTGQVPTTTVANLANVFGDETETHRFVKRYLKATHCDVFFADAVIFAEGSAERILVPHFIRHHFPTLSRRYISLVDLGGSHAHSFKSLVDELGLSTLVIGDLDATIATEVETKRGKAIRWKAAKPTRGVNQKTANSVLKEWHPKLELIDDLLALPPEGHALETGEGYALHVAYQTPISVLRDDGSHSEVIPRTFEDALILANLEALKDIKGVGTTAKVRAIVTSGLQGEELEDELFELLKTAEKASLAVDCLTHFTNAKAIVPPAYVFNGLAWLQELLSEPSSTAEPAADTTKAA